MEWVENDDHLVAFLNTPGLRNEDFPVLDPKVSQ